MAADTDYEFDRGPTPVSYMLPLATLEYMLRLNELGLIEGPLGDQRLSPDVEKIMWALHNLLAGGEVSVEIKRRGNPDIVRNLEARMAQGTKDANEINKKAGYYVTVLPL
jgi:hypothetical protein